MSIVDATDEEAQSIADPMLRAREEAEVLENIVQPDNTHDEACTCSCCANYCFSRIAAAQLAHYIRHAFLPGLHGSADLRATFEPAFVTEEGGDRQLVRPLNVLLVARQYRNILFHSPTLRYSYSNLVQRMAICLEHGLIPYKSSIRLLDQQLKSDHPLASATPLLYAIAYAEPCSSRVNPLWASIWVTVLSGTKDTVKRVTSLQCSPSRP